MKYELKKLVFLLSLVSGAAVSVYSADLMVGELPGKGDLRFTLDAEGAYISDICHLQSEYDAFAGTVGAGVGYSFLKGLDLSFYLPFYADMLDGDDAVGLGDLDIDLFWLPLADVPVSPVFSLKSTIPTGSDNGLIPRTYNLYSGEHAYYTNDDFAMSFSLGIDFDLSKRSMPLRFNYLCTPQFIFSDDTYSILSNSFGFQWFASDYLTPGFTFQMETPVDADDPVGESSYELSALMKISPSRVLDIQTDFSFGLGDAHVERGAYEFSVVPLFSFGIAFDFYRRGKEDSVNTTAKIQERVQSNSVSEQHSFGAADTLIPVEDTVALIDSVKMVIPEYTDRDNDGIYDSLDKCPDAPELYNRIEDEDGCPDFQNSASKASAAAYILEGVEFSSGSTALSYEAKKSLDALLNTLKKNSEMKIELRGYSDYSGGYVTNINISQKRAESVMNYLLSEGVKKQQVRAVGYGPNSPVADNRTSKGRRLNRRIEYTVLD